MLKTVIRLLKISLDTFQVYIQGDQEIHARFSNQKKNMRQETNIIKFGWYLANFLKFLKIYTVLKKFRFKGAQGARQRSQV
jgi:hypothetical protein